MTLHCTIKSFRVVTIVLSLLIQPSIQLWEESELGILWILSIVGLAVSGERDIGALAGMDRSRR